jgi:hypothetical protein
VLTTVLEEMRADILELFEHWPDLAERFCRLRDELEMPLNEMDFSMKFEQKVENAWKDHVGRRAAAGEELDELINDIRRRPAFKDFLLPLSKAKIR